MTDDPTHPANPYAAEAATAPRLEDREGYPFAAPRKPTTDLSDEAQLGARCAVCGKPIAPNESYSDTRGGPWHRLCIPPPDGERAQAAPPAGTTNDTDPVRIIGRVKWFDIIHGYGFITAEVGPLAGQDVMLHADTLRASGYWPRVPPRNVRIVADAWTSRRGWRVGQVLRIDYVD